mgnify:CR=1 FL=1
MYKLDKQKSFTLIEIIVVLIILGALATIALPVYFSWVNRVKVGAVAVQNLRTLKDQLLGCLRANVGDPHIGVKCICNGFPHDISDTMGGWYGTQCNDPATTNWNNIAFKQGNYAVWITNRESIGYETGESPYVHFNGGVNPQAWTITAYYFPDGNVTANPSPNGAIYITGSADDTVFRCQAWRDLEGAC